MLEIREGERRIEERRRKMERGGWCRGRREGAHDVTGKLTEDQTSLVLSAVCVHGGTEGEGIDDR